MIKVAIVEGQRPIRESLATLVGGLRNYRVVGGCASAEGDIKLVKLHDPHVLLRDILRRKLFVSAVNER